MLILDGLFRCPVCATTGNSDTNSFKRICSLTVLSPHALNWDTDPSLARNIKALPSIFCSERTKPILTMKCLDDRKASENQPFWCAF